MNKIKQSIALDCERIIDVFAAKQNLKFETFCKEWKRMYFHHIYSGLVRDVEIVQMTEEFFVAISRILFEINSSTPQRIGALYLIYSLFFKQPTKEYVKLKLTIKNWISLKMFIESLEDGFETSQVKYIFYKLIASNAFRFVVMEKECGLEPIMNRDARKGCFQLDNPLNSIVNDVNELEHPTKGYLESLSILEGGYNEMKKILNEKTEIGANSSYQKVDITGVMDKIKTSFTHISSLLKTNEDDDGDKRDSSETMGEAEPRKRSVYETRASIKRKAKKVRPSKRISSMTGGCTVALSGEMIQITSRGDNRTRLKKQKASKMIAQQLPSETLNELGVIEDLQRAPGDETRVDLPTIIPLQAVESSSRSDNVI